MLEGGEKRNKKRKMEKQRIEERIGKVMWGLKSEALRDTRFVCQELEDREIRGKRKEERDKRFGFGLQEFRIYERERTWIFGNLGFIFDTKVCLIP